MKESLLLLFTSLLFLSFSEKAKEQSDIDSVNTMADTAREQTAPTDPKTNFARYNYLSFKTDLKADFTSKVTGEKSTQDPILHYYIYEGT